MIRKLALLLSAGVAWAGSAPPANDAQDRAVLFISSDMRGYLAPCGCSENMRGGVPRAAHQIQEARRSGAKVFYFDAGDSLFPKTKLLPDQVPQEERKAKALAEAFKQMGLDARAAGERDDARGVAFRKKLGLPELAFGQARVFEADGQKLAVAAGDSAKTLAAATKKAKAEGAQFVVGLFHGTFADAQKAANDHSVQANLIVASHAASELDGDDNRLLKTRIPVAQVQSKGRSLMRVDVSFAKEDSSFELLSTQADAERELAAMSERIALLNRQINLPGMSPEAKKLRQQKLEELVVRREALAAQKAPTVEGKDAYAIRFIPLEATLPSDKAAKELLTAYDRDVAQLNLAWAKKFGKDCPPPKKGQPGFVGNASCQECHEEAFPVWEASKHAHGYETLVEANKQFHLDCVGCHVTGFRQPGGVCRVDKVKGREDVGCESCHGPGSLHAEDPAAENISLGNTAEACVGCHDAENSPHFDFATYLPQVLGPGHGKPVAAKE